MFANNIINILVIAEIGTFSSCFLYKMTITAIIIEDTIKGNSISKNTILVIANFL
ncbi:Uncharacterised protein [Chlamydia trachomatis]|nr:Uncharacterised protein [Chlamydia trachomatis]